MSHPTQENKDDKKRDKNPNQTRTTAREDAPVEQEAAVERGERIATGKAIARGGKGEGDVAGATPSSKSSPNPKDEKSFGSE